MARLSTVILFLFALVLTPPSVYGISAQENPWEGQDGKHFFHSVYPNPASTEVAFSIELQNRELVEIEIYNQIGKKVDLIREKIYEAGDCKVLFDVSEYKKGLYFVHVKIGQERYIRKFSVLR